MEYKELKALHKEIVDTANRVLALMDKAGISGRDYTRVKQIREDKQKPVPKEIFNDYKNKSNDALERNVINDKNDLTNLKRLEKRYANYADAVKRNLKEEKLHYTNNI